MGILDDAIREHLELKRKHGAASSDLERLEKEAFGPSERPGEADSEGAAIAAPEAEPEQQAADAEAEAAGEDRAPEAESGWLEEVDLEAEEDEEPLAEAEPVPEEPRTPTELARVEHPELDDTADHPALAEEPAEPGGEGAAEPPEAPEAAIFDHEEGAERVEGEVEHAGEEDVEPEAAAEETEADFDLDLELPEDSATEHPLPPPAGGHEGEAPEGGDEDLLEETPEFLQDTPEDEQLWFEQRGKPKDFDFDE